ncbi:nck-associated protein 5-like isoform X5 [Sparus aurata]|uniref:Nck-associated protein 5-like n=1 Tax=Sparus aurata TaxID=8175 RepID=A0A671V6R5_SPAAU|nr:nck-associated protein 5-like isoform X5 [Sparus aurata]
MVTLQQHFSSMEETVRTLLQNQDSLEGPKVDPLDLMKAYKDKLLEEMWKQQDSLEGPTATAAERPASPEAGGGGGGGSEENSKDSNPLLERLRALEAENSALSMENDNQRKQYERCLDEVANQVVQALLTQKDLKEECVKLRTRVFDLEQQNRILSVLFQQRVKMSTIPVSQEVQRNGKAGIPAGRWPSLLSLTCPRSSGSGSGSELSLSSACSEYSSGSHTWAEGRGSSKQSAMSRDKRMSAGSVSSNHSAHIETELGWKEGHILKGLKRLQMSGSKEASSFASVPHCKDCMTSNEGIYSFGVKFGLQGSTAKQVAPTSKPFKGSAGVAGLDSDDADDESPKLQSRESSDQPTKELLCLEKLDVTRDDDNNFQEVPIKLEGNSAHFPSPVTDNFVFLEGPTVKPGVSPTDSLTHLEEKKDSLEKLKPSGLKLSDRNNNQERSTDRKSRLDHVKRQQGRLLVKDVETGTSDVSSSIPHSATRALSCESVSRQRSSSMEVPHRRDQAIQAGSESQNYTISEYSQRKPKPQPCESARKAFILRSKSADGGQEQQKHTHSPLHQKLIKGHRPKGQPSPAGQSVPNKRTNLSKTHDPSKGALSKVEKDENSVLSASSKSLKSVQQRSPLASPVKNAKTFKPQMINESSKSPTKSPLQITRHQSSSDSVEESIYDNLPCSPRKQRRQEQHCDASRSEVRSPSPPLPPGRTSSLFLRPSSDILPKGHSSTGQAQSATTGKMTSSTTKQQSNLSSILQPQTANATKDNQMGAEGKAVRDTPAKVYHAHPSKIPSVPVQESQPSESVQLSMDRAAICHECHDGVPCILPSQSILQRSQQSISEPKLSEVLPQTYSNVYYHGIPNNLQSSTSRAIKMALPVNAKSHEAISGQDTFLVFGRQNKDDATAKSVQTFQTFTCDPQMMHECGANDKARRKIETRCNSLDSEPSVQPVASDSGVMLDWGYDEEGWLFKRSVSVSTRPPLKPVMGMNGAKARSQSFGARYMDRPSFNRAGKVRTQIKTHSGSSLNSLNDVLPGSMSCSSSYHCPMNRSLLNNFLIEEGLTVPSQLGSSSERLQSLKLQREQARRLQIEQQFSSAFGEPVSEEPERQSTITTIEEKVMLGIEENLHKTQEQERSVEVKQKSGSTLANWFGFRKSKLPAPSSKKTDPPKGKEEKREQKITSLLGGKQTKSDKKRDRRKSDGKDCSVGRRESHDAVRACISMPCPGMSLNDIQGHSDIIGDPKMQMGNLRADGENGSTVKSPNQDSVIVCRQK